MKKKENGIGVKITGVRLFLLAGLIVSMFAGCGQSSPAGRVTGSWTGEIYGDKYTISFKPGGNVTLSDGEETMEGEYTVGTLVTITIEGDEELFVLSADGKTLHVADDPEVAFSKSGAPGSVKKSDWNKLLKNYEKFVNDYIAVAKKAASGDVKALEKAASLMEQAQELAEQLGKASDDLTSEQSAKLLELQEKMLEVAF
ncbi:MAG: hypothetical protein LBP29_00960 [Treponema sp.]|jgi:hypothetical protein|nr:hypothetical protein [Treponema sp.]